VPGHRVLLLGTARPGLPDGFLSSISRLDHCARLPLPRLGPKDLSRLLVDAFRSERLAEELAFKIGAKSDGNPWFVFEILRGLREGQFLSRRPDGTWVTTRVIEDIEVPSTVKDLVFGRVGDLATEDRNLLDVAAVAGFEFDAALVGEVVGLGRIPSLQRLAGVEKTHHLVHSAGRRFVFDHHQVAEVLYAALPEPLREEYHAALGDAIERRHGAAAKEPKDVDGAVCVDLAEHFLKGGKGERALRYLDAGLRHLERGNQAESAIRLAGSALSAPGMLDVPQRCDLLRRRAALGAEQGRIADADRDTAASLALAEARGDPVLVARARMSVAYVRLRQSHLDDAEPLLQSALALSREAGDTSNEAACRSNLGGLLGIRGRMAEAVAETERAALLFGSVRDLSGEARSVCNIACFLTTMGRFDEALLVLTRAREIARRAGNRGQEANIDGQTGLVYLNLSRASDGRAALERQLASARELGDRQNEIRATANLGLALEMLGLYADALSSARRSLELSRELGLPGDEAAALLVLGELHAKCGEIVPARRDLDACVVLSRLSHEATFEAAALDRIAELVSEESYEESERFAAEALELRRRIQAAAEAADTLCGRGARRARHGRIEGAVADLDAAIEQARALGLHGVEKLALVRRAILPGGDVAAAVEAWRGMTSEVGMSLCLEAELLLWRATCDRAHLVEAKRLLDHLVEHAPPECRGPMLVNVRLHREVAGAARAHGL
jgi:tetratricopeptide (TPR) repeat protein